MDTFTSLEEGSTSGDAELQDIRVGYDGTTYDTAGNAVREQISDVRDEIGCLDKIVNKINTDNIDSKLIILWEQGTWASFNTNGKADADNIIRSNKLYYFDEPITNL